MGASITKWYDSIWIAESLDGPSERPYVSISSGIYITSGRDLNGFSPKFISLSGESDMQGLVAETVK